MAWPGSPLCEPAGNKRLNNRPVAALAALFASAVASCSTIADHDPVDLAIRNVTIVSPERAFLGATRR